ncbi:MAG: hypothetical protein OQJ89_16715 [Kangiellaceae bacterium]|nr:hypothetical protein [Kangiellaceae bacterium]
MKFQVTRRYLIRQKSIFILTFLLTCFDSIAVTGRHPTGVNVNSNGPTTVVITFHQLEQNEQPVDAFWCGDVTSTGVVVGTNPCVPGTLLGHLPRRLDLSKVEGEAFAGGLTDLGPGGNSSSGVRNMTDVMSIPNPVIRRAYQLAQDGASSEFFYVRQFSNNGINTYVTVTCRMAGGGARTQLALSKVDLNFNDSETRKAITLIKQSGLLTPFSAKINYTGAGLLKGRWEVVMPGEVAPNRFDLLSEASLSISDRPLQKRYKLISRFQKFLAPNGKVIIPGPNPKLLPTAEKGLYQVLLRIEASSDKDSNTDTLTGIVNTGGAAGFAMPTLKYFVGDSNELKQNKIYPPISLLLPQNNQRLSEKQLQFSWFEMQDTSDVAIYKIEFYAIDGEKKLLTSALLKPGNSKYKPPKNLIKKLDQLFYWRVLAINSKGKILSSSQLRKLKLTSQGNF